MMGATIAKGIKRNNKFPVVCVLLLIIVMGCVSQGDGTTTAEAVAPASSLGENQITHAPVPERIEVFHFHGNHQCYSCIMVGQYAEETVNTYFADELKSGKIVFAHVNAELPENAELAIKYGVTSASLWIGVYDENGFHAEQNIDVWYKIRDKDAYMEYLKGVLEAKLGRPE